MRHHIVDRSGEMQQRGIFDNDGVSRRQDDIWNDDDDDDDETKLTDRQTENGLEETNGNRIVLDQRRKLSDVCDGKQLMSGDGGKDDGGWYDMFDVVARQDDWMTCSAAFAIHLAYDGLRLAAIIWLTEAIRQFQLSHTAIGKMSQLDF
jgi:hypothetical protein